MKNDKQNKQEQITKRSLGWRGATVAIVALSVTCFCVCWVKVTSIMANRDVRIAEIRK